MIKPNSWNGWDPLKVCMVGSCVPDNFFNSIKDRKLASDLNRIVEETNEDLAFFIETLEKHGVEVVRPGNIDYFDDDFHKTMENIRSDNDGEYKQSLEHTGLIKPELTPRDWLIIMGKKAFATTPNTHRRKLCDKLFEKEDYISLNASRNELWWLENPEWHGGFAAPYVTRVGEDIICDTEDHKDKNYELTSKFFPDYNYTQIAEGGHSDGIFSPVKPGHIISIEDVTKNLYEKSFPNWEIFYVNKHESMPEKWWDFKKWHREFDRNPKEYWSNDLNDNPALSQFVDEWLYDWVGFAVESVFEVNMLSLSENKVMGSTRHKKLEKHLEKIGMEFIHVPFRHRRFWDGGLHCLTVDLVRDGDKQKYQL